MFSLSAQNVAEALGISTRTLHRGLAACQQSFGASLMAARELNLPHECWNRLSFAD